MHPVWKSIQPKQKQCGWVPGEIEQIHHLTSNGPQEPIRALGVFFSYNSDDANNLNFGEKIRKLEKPLNSWKRRKLTLHGRIKIVKTLGLSKLIYNTSVHSRALCERN